MNIQIQIDPVYDNQYYTVITVSDVEQGYFPAIIKNRGRQGEDTRIIEVEIMAMEQSPGGSMTVGTRDYRRKDGETTIKVILLQDGNEIASQTANYE